MRTATIVSLICGAVALSGCATHQGIEFVASNPDSVLLDFPARPPGDLVSVNTTATQQCQIFSRRTAVLESLNVRGEGELIRATYLCKDSMRTADTTVGMRHRQ